MKYALTRNESMILEMGLKVELHLAPLGDVPTLQALTNFLQRPCDWSYSALLTEIERWRLIYDKVNDADTSEESAP